MSAAFVSTLGALSTSSPRPFINSTGSSALSGFCRAGASHRRFRRLAVQCATSGRAAAAAGHAAMPAAEQRQQRQQQQQSASSFQACSRPDVVEVIRDKYADLGGWPEDDKLPVMYNTVYNIGFWGLERLHPFDSKKFQRVLAILEANSVLRESQMVTAREATHEILREVHTEQYLAKLSSSSFTVAMVTELAPLAFLPPFLLRRKVLRPMATMAGGTMLAAALAMQHGWAINLGGGMHHATHDNGGGWCPYADLTLALRRLRQASGGRISKFLVVDLDVHQGNGVERCKQHFEEDRESVFIVDVYGQRLYPWDTAAKEAIDVKRELPLGTADAEYLEAVGSGLREAFERFEPHLLIYNAGTDILEGDPLGRMQVSAEGVVQRDQLVWQAALDHGVPIVQLLSGGYTKASTPCIASSIQNLFAKFALGGVPAA